MFGNRKGQTAADKRTPGILTKKKTRKYRASGPSHMEEETAPPIFKRNLVSRHSPLQNLVPVKNGELCTIAVLLFVSSMTLMRGSLVSKFVSFATMTVKFNMI